MKTKEELEQKKDEVKIENLEKVSGGVRYNVTLWRCPTCGATRQRSEMVGQISTFDFFTCLNCGTAMSEQIGSWTEERPN